jgi:hypothetical protein
MKTLVAAFFTCTASLHAAAIISEIDLLGNKVELVNDGAVNVDLNGYFLCNRFTGSPFYQALITSMIDLPNSTDGDLVLGPGHIMTLQLTASFITDATGEFGLYRNGSNFGSSANIVDYVGWGADGVRDSVAAAAGIWTNGTFVNVSGLTTGQSIQLKFGQPGNSAGDYEIRSSTIGVAQSVPEPASAGLLALGGWMLVHRRRRAG